MNRWFGLASFALLGLVACGSSDDEEGAGTVAFTIWGEEYIEDGIPSEAFEDGWSVRFERFLITVGDISVGDAKGERGGTIVETRLFDLVTPGPHVIDTLSLEARSWNRVGYSVPAAGADTVVSEAATDADLEMMRREGYSVYVAGTATLGDESKTFAWGFTNSTRYDHCRAEREGQEVEGVVVTNGGEDQVELTIHGDHFFYDDLASPDAVPRFAALAAADADDDGEVTLEELRAVKLVEVAEGTYGTGSRSHVDDLGSFVEAQTTTLGHYRGEGHCVADDS